MKNLRSFRSEDDGVVTVDWVLLTAFLAGFAALISSAMTDGGSALAVGIMDYMSNWTFE